MKKEKKQSLTLAPASGALVESGGALEASPFIKIEKNLIAMGFFTPTRPGLKTTRVKTVKYTGKDDKGAEVITTIRINTGGNYGLPGTADLDKFLALQRLINNVQKRNGVVTNPITFTSWELLAVLGLRKKAGKNYALVSEWLDRMCATTIEAVGEGFVAGQRRSGKDRIQVFRRGITFGSEIEKGVIADRNYVWLEDWLLDSINRHFLVPIDFGTYLSLENSIAKTLVPLLQIWLYASRGNVFEKSYEDLCQLLGITQCAHESKIKERLGPSLDELIKHGYLAGWKVEQKRGADGYKLVLKHGDKFHRDLAENQQRGERSAVGDSEEGRQAEEEARWVELLVERGVLQAVAQSIVAKRAEGQHIGDQVEWIDNLIKRKGRGYFTNPPGLFISLIKANAPIDPNFETTRMRELREERDAREREQSGAQGEGFFDVGVGEPRSETAPTEVDLFQLRCEYDRYVQGEVASALKALGKRKYEQLLDEEREAFKNAYPDAAKVYTASNITGCAEAALEKKYAAGLSLMTFEEFAAERGVR